MVRWFFLGCFERVCERRPDLSPKNRIVDFILFPIFLSLTTRSRLLRRATIRTAKRKQRTPSREMTNENNNASQGVSAASAPAGFSASTPPTSAEMRKADTLAVLDENGKKVNFRELYAISPAGEGEGARTVVLVIRQFYCGLCREFSTFSLCSVVESVFVEDFISYLITKITPSALLAANARLVIIGCGSYELIKPYKELLNCPFEIYTDPTKELYTALGMTLRTLAQGNGGKEPEYLRRSALGNIFGSIMVRFRRWH